jgi:hypothetical protein
LIPFSRAAPSAQQEGWQFGVTDVKNRICRLWFEIEQNGQAKRYSLAPLFVEELGTGFVAGFKVTNRSEEPQPVYLVRVRATGAVHCTCPAYGWDERKAQSPNTPPQQPEPTCKHCEALAAAGTVTRNMLDVLKARTKLLDAAEDRIEQLTKNRDIEREAACRNADSLRQTIAHLESELSAVSQRAVQLQNARAVETAVPRKRSRKTVAA